MTEYTDSNVAYFPAYEIVNDELRDYRFYKSDMLHPNEQAVEYIWERLVECLFLCLCQRISARLEACERSSLPPSFQSRWQRIQRIYGANDRTSKIIGAKI